MSPNPPQIYAARWQTLRPWLVTLGVVWLLGSAGLGWLVKSFLFLMGLIVVTPILGFLGLRWWISRTLVQNACPVCQYEFSALNNSQANCPNCGEALSIQDGQFQRLSIPGTIDVQAVDVTVQAIEDDT